MRIDSSSAIIAKFPDRYFPSNLAGLSNDDAQNGEVDEPINQNYRGVCHGDEFQT